MNDPAQEGEEIPPANVLDALRYTPISSCVPFPTDTIPLPLPVPAGLDSVFRSDRERLSSGQTLDALDRQLLADPDSRFVKQQLHELGELINAPTKTEFRFKSSGDAEIVSDSEELISGNVFERMGVGSFAQMILDRSNVPFKYPGFPVSESSSKSAQRSAPSSQKADVVKIPPPPETFDRSQYVKHTETDKRLLSKPARASSDQRKRIRSHSDGKDGEALGSGIDQRIKADGFLKSLQKFLHSIFEAEDNLSPDTSDRVADKGSKYWMVGSRSPCLATAVQVKLEDAIHKVIMSGRFRDVSVDDLVRIQKLCENSLKQAESVGVMVGADSDDLAIEEWLARISLVDNGLKTAKTVIRMMLGGREEKQIYPEDVLASVLNLTKNIIEDAINRIIEMRPVGEEHAVFKVASSYKKILGGLLHEITGLLSLIGEFLASEEVSDHTITTLEFIAAPVIFVENAPTEKDSVFDVQKVERFRVTAMDVFAQVFARYPDQRTFIFDQILTSLEKLSVNRQSARQFKLAETGKNIQLVSALIIRLVQISGTYQDRRKKRRLILDDDGEVMTEKFDDNNDYKGREADHIGSVDGLYVMSNSLLDSARKSALYVVNFLVRRAMKSTKSGDQPYRILMDIFTEDLITVLGFPEWPGAELLLQCILGSMFRIVDGDKQTAPAKSMALDLLGLMGSAICDVVTYLRESHKNVVVEGDKRARYLYSLTEDYLSGVSATKIEEKLIGWHGPFRYSLEYLLEIVTHNPSLKSAWGYYLTTWSTRVCALSEKLDGENDKESEQVVKEMARTAANLRRTMVDNDWIERDFMIEIVPPALLRQAYVLTVLHMPFCTLFGNILNRLLRSLEDNQATTRSKGLKSVFQLIQRSAAILERPQVVPMILKRLRDSSPLVRDSVVDLIGKCISLQPSLENQVYKSIIERSADAAVGVRKRSMKILKEIYMRSPEEVVKVAIAEALLQRIKDSDSTISELAKKTFEEIWIMPFYPYMGAGEADVAQSPEEISPQLKLSVNQRVSVIIKVVQKEVMQGVLHDIIKSILHVDTKNCSLNFKVCKTMVWSMCDFLLNEQGDEDRVNRTSTLRALTVFAKANPNLFTSEQLVMFQPYIGDLSAQDDLHVFRSVIIIFRCALPVMPSVHSGFLSTVQQTLLGNISRLPSTELKEVILCIWAISVILGNTDRLARVTISCMTNILEAKKRPIETSEQANRLLRLLHILGLLGKHCQFDDKPELFKKAFPTWTGALVSEFITDTIAPFCVPSMHPLVRRSALQSLCHVCQTHASHFLKPEVLKSFDEIFEAKKEDLTNLALVGIKGLLLLEEHRSDEFHGEEEEKNGGESGVERLSRAANVNQNDGVSTSLAQRFLKNIVEIATASQDGYALTATEVIGSILRQGLVHPKECVPALVALETSTNPAIQTLAYREHRTLHSKHESIVERGYMDGARSCFLYQRNVVGDAAGARTNPFVSKMHPLYEIVRTSRKVRKKLLGNLTMSVDFEPANLDPNSALGFPKFVIENLAFFEYGTLDELYHVVTAMERVVAGTGMTIAHSIETDVFFLKLHVEGEQVVNPEVLRTLASGSAILSMLWECRYFLRKCYGINDNKSRDFKMNKLSTKDANKAPLRVPNWTTLALAFWERIKEITSNLGSKEGMMEQCRDFVELLNVDNEFKLAAEGEDAEDVDGDKPGTPYRDIGDDGGTGVEFSTPTSKKRKANPATSEKGSAKAKKKTNRKLPKPVWRK